MHNLVYSPNWWGVHFYLPHFVDNNFRLQGKYIDLNLCLVVPEIHVLRHEAPLLVCPRCGIAVNLSEIMHMSRHIAFQKAVALTLSHYWLKNIYIYARLVKVWILMLYKTVGFFFSFEKKTFPRIKKVSVSLLKVRPLLRHSSFHFRFPLYFSWILKTNEVRFIGSNVCVGGWYLTNVWKSRRNRIMTVIALGWWKPVLFSFSWAHIWIF